MIPQITEELAYAVAYWLSGHKLWNFQIKKYIYYRQLAVK